MVTSNHSELQGVGGEPHYGKTRTDGNAGGFHAQRESSNNLGSNKVVSPMDEAPSTGIDDDSLGRNPSMMMMAPNMVKEHTLRATFTEEDTLMNVGTLLAFSWRTMCESYERKI